MIVPTVVRYEKCHMSCLSQKQKQKQKRNGTIYCFRNFIHGQLKSKKGTKAWCGLHGELGSLIKDERKAREKFMVHGLV
jgi:hypothetical protein